MPLSATFLRLRSDEQLVSLFRAGSDDAFGVIHDRYRGRLHAYVRQMLRGSGGDPEDATQDVFVRAFKSLRASNRPILLRAWLYRIAHNRCIDELRRPITLQTELDGEERPAVAALTMAPDPAIAAERSETIARLVADVQTLPAPQRSVLLMRELQGMSYLELSASLGVSVPAVKSLLLRARTGLVDLRTARETPCGDIHADLAAAADRGVRMNARARRHLRDCSDCRTYHRELRSVHKGLAALAPVGPFAKLASLLGAGGGGASSSAAAGGGGAAAGGTMSGGAGLLGAASTAKIAAVVATAAVIGGATPVALQVTAGSSKPGLHFPANASQLTATTGATVAPSSPSAAVGAGLASPAGAAGGGPASELALGTTGTTGATGTTLTTGATGATGATGMTAATGASTTSGPTGTSGSTTATGATEATTASGGTIAGSSGPSGGTAVATSPPPEQPAPIDPQSVTAVGPSGPTATVARATGDSGESGSSGATPSATGSSGAH